MMPAAVAVPDDLARAREQIAALERKIGQQALELDFFGQALLMEQVGRAADRKPLCSGSRPICVRCRATAHNLTRTG